MRRLIVDVIRVGYKDHRGIVLISDALPFGRLWDDTPDHAIGYAKHRSRSHHAVIQVYDEAGNVIKTHEHANDFQRTVAGVPEKRYRFLKAMEDSGWCNNEMSDLARGAGGGRELCDYAKCYPARRY
jgi:hypothetical protein